MAGVGVLVAIVMYCLVETTQVIQIESHGNCIAAAYPQYVCLYQRSVCLSVCVCVCFLMIYCVCVFVCLYIYVCDSVCVFVCVCARTLTHTLMHAHTFVPVSFYEVLTVQIAMVYLQ